MRVSLRRSNEPKYQVIRESIRAAIISGEFAPGQRMPTEEELGEKFGASRNTVIRALVDLKDAGLLERTQGSGTFVSAPTARSQQVFAFVAGGSFDVCSKDTVFGKLELELARRLHQLNAGYSLLPDLRSEGQRPDAHRAETVDRLCKQGVAGVFLLPGEGSLQTPVVDRPLLDRLGSAGITTILLDRDIYVPPLRSEYDLVSLDNLRAGMMVGQHLARQGCRRILFCLVDKQAITVQQRLAGIRMAIEAVGGQVEVVVVTEDAEMLAALKPRTFDAIVGKDDHLAAMAMRALYLLGRRVPDEVKLVGFDDAPLAHELAVPLTTYAQPIEALADSAVTLMLSRVKEPKQPAREIVVSGKLIVRRSTALI